MLEWEVIIISLNCFYDLFCNFVEGLYILMLEGDIKIVNFVMCVFFGFEDEM